jgi:thiol-disulfide isomerase/thioredoxin
MNRMKNLLSLCVALTVLAQSARGADAPVAKTADELWQSIQTMQQTPPPRDRTQILERMGQLHGALVEFEQRFPSDTRHWDAKLLRVEVEYGLARADNRPADDTALFALTKEVVAAPDASPETKADARYLAAEMRMELLGASGSVTNGPARAAADAAIQEVRQKYPDDPRTFQMQFDVAEFFKVRDPQAAEAIFHELETNKNPQVAAVAHQDLLVMKKQQNVTRTPLDLKFQAVDGTAVDLAKLRGKVVLLDFWATWCGPCRMEIPNVVATYNALHSQGFEIVGISLDQDKEQMVKFTKAAGMAWPQYFDGKRWENEISTRFGIDSIPAAWLLDKKGFVRSTEARGDNLAEQVKKLLAE